ncbi:dephospho-CoA kinase [Aquimarina intermedia]|uniref:Dephospho-CoA kinase n=1 Tax=Aquimarina intermedia TaxID=350814 RepID=A0A5S5BYL4_9FLAO|nr:dephospho-CoA kinase [Aquimarina intermedia]TYP72265.1 dephospho-CoA kinase [Aquimarina intermedia]
MKIVGLTGGIGSGKSTIANMFKSLGVPVYIADIEAKKLMNNDPKVQRALINLFGVKAYIEGALNRTFIADKVFKDKALLEKLNAIVHPAVARHFENWKNRQNARYGIKEVAILFENKGQEQCDHTILVTAPEELRIQRVLDRDDTSVEKVKQRMNNQWKDSQKIPLADFVIQNIDLKEAKKQVLELHQKFME